MNSGENLGCVVCLIGVVLVFSIIMSTFLLAIFYRKKDLENQLRYQQHLESIKKRVEERPLLLEQVSSHSTDLARTNYTAALQKVGFSSEEVETLLKEISEADKML